MKKIFFVTLIVLLLMPFISIQAKEIIIKNDVINGTITADKKEAEVGEIVTLKVVPNEGYQLESISVLDKFDEMPVTVTGNSFEMPSYNVFISAKFEKVAENVEEANNYVETLNNGEEISKNNTITYVICGVGALLIIAALIYIVTKNKK